MAKASPQCCTRPSRCSANALLLPTGPPDLIRGRLFGVRLFLLFFILLLILTVSRSKIAQRLLWLQAGLLKACLLPIAQAWAAVRAGGPCRGQGHRAHTQTLSGYEALCPVWVEVTRWGSQGYSQGSVAGGEGRGQELDVAVRQRGSKVRVQSYCHQRGR